MTYLAAQVFGTNNYIKQKKGPALEADPILNTYGKRIYIILLKRDLPSSKNRHRWFYLPNSQRNCLTHI